MKTCTHCPKPYYEHANMTIYQGDCLTIMPTLPGASVDLVLADLPYGTTACAWDSIIPLEPLWAEYRRLLKPGGAVVLTASQPFTSRLVMSNLDWFKYSLVWHKTMATNFLNANNRPLVAHEDIVIFSPATTANGSPNKMTYNPQMESGRGYTRAYKNDRRVGAWERGGRTPFAFGTVENSGTRYPRSVVEFANANSDSLHPTQKPLALMAYLIATYSNPGDIILDNTMGSGTTLRAAKDAGRRAIGIEMEERYCEIAARRLSQEVLELAI